MNNFVWFGSVAGVFCVCHNEERIPNAVNCSYSFKFSFCWSSNHFDINPTPQWFVYIQIHYHSPFTIQNVCNTCFISISNSVFCITNDIITLPTAIIIMDVWLLFHWYFAVCIVFIKRRVSIEHLVFDVSISLLIQVILPIWSSCIQCFGKHFWFSANKPNLVYLTKINSNRITTNISRWCVSHTNTFDRSSWARPLISTWNLFEFNANRF